MKEMRINQGACTGERNYGIDLLRIVSMILIAMLHVLGHGGVLGSTASGSVKYGVAWFVELCAYCSVNCYALISGYVGYGKSHKLRSLIGLYLQVMFYTLLITGVFFVCRREAVTAGVLLGAVLPVPFQTYWYFTAYFCLFFFTPFLDRALDQFSKKTTECLLLTTFVIICVLPTLFYKDFAVVNNGFSPLWLGILYMTGAYLKKYGSPVKATKGKWLVCWLLCVAATFVSKLAVEAVTRQVFGAPRYGNWFVQYNSPTIVLASVALLLFFRELSIGAISRKWIAFFAPATFGVYLLHEEPLIRQYLVNGSFASLADWNALLIPFGVVAAALGIWLMCSLAEKCRSKLFELLRIHKLCAALERVLLRLLPWLRDESL